MSELHLFFNHWGFLDGIKKIQVKSDHRFSMASKQNVSFSLLLFSQNFSHFWN